jgi:nitrogen regulatory protein PII
MQTHKAKRVEITIEAVMQNRLTGALHDAGVTGFTILPVLGGRPVPRGSSRRTGPIRPARAGW